MAMLRRTLPILLIFLPPQTYADMKFCPIPDFKEAYYDDKGETKLMPGDKIRVNCREDCYKQMITYTICLQDYTWTTPDPPCKLIKCPKLDAPGHGSVHHTGCTANSTVTITCHPRFVYNGSTPRTCQPNGQWSGVGGICKDIECPPITSLTFGEVIQTGYNIGDEIKFYCSRTHRYTGTRTRKCQENGEWSGEPGVCEEVKCPCLTIHNGTLHYKNIRVGGEVEVRCEKGFIYTKPEFTKRYCTIDGFWNGEDGHCEEMPELGKNGNPELGQCICRLGYTDKIFLWLILGVLVVNLLILVIAILWMRSQLKTTGFHSNEQLQGLLNIRSKQ